MGSVLLELQAADGVTSRVCVTGQHREMLDQVLPLFSVVPDHDLTVMTEQQSPSAVAAAVLGRLEQVLRQEQPDWLLVQGDTTSAAAAALGGFYAGIRVGHVEAGLRTHDRRQPFPEEMNRRLVGALADRHFAPTPRARRDLLAEGVPEDAIVVTGNPVIDALHHVAGRSSAGLDFLPESVQQRLAVGVRLLLVTMHRRESLGKGLEQVCGAIRDLVQRYRDSVQVVFPVHLNPAVGKVVQRQLSGEKGVSLLPPLNYEQFVQLLRASYLVLTDSGGVQEEAPALGVPVLVTRHCTERPEAESAGCALVVGTDRGKVLSAASHLLDDAGARAAMSRVALPFGDGRAAERIVASLLDRPVSPFVPVV